MVFGNLDVDIPCPECRKKFKMKLHEIRNGAKVTCPKCKKVINLKVEGDDLTRPDKELNKLLDNLKDININIKL